MNTSDVITSIAETFPVVEGWLRGEASGQPPRSPACDVAERFNLDAFGRNTLLVCAYTTLEPTGRETLAHVLGDPTVAAPTVGLVLARVPGAYWQALSAEAPLRRAGLVHVDGSGAMVDARLRLPETVLFRLLGAPSLDASAAPMLKPIEVPRTLAPNRQALSKEVAARLQITGAPVLHITGLDPDGKLVAFADAAAAMGERAYMLSAELLPQSAAELTGFAAALARDMRLSNGRVILVVDDTADPRLATLFAEVYDAPLAIASHEALRVGHRLALRIEMPRLAVSEQLQVWHDHLAEQARDLGDTLPRLAGTFHAAPEVVESISAELSLEDDRTPEHLAGVAWKACRVAARPKMDDLAQRVVSPAAWDDLILPTRQKQVLESIVAQIRNRNLVYDDWGFGERLQMKGLGVSALFSGPSGAGKSMAGEVLGNALDLDVYRVDLASIVSKWVGETEKNLRRVFDAAEDGGVILQFDEADALFGKRSEVKDSHDRHANIEVSYLLQRLEAYRGLCILTTNMRDNIDEAFLRRLRFIIDFRFPKASERRAIWQRIFPAEMPKAPLDYDCLAQLNVPGGSIRNIALGASFLAADRGASVSMSDILHSAELEYDKVGRSMTDAERAGWPQ